MREEERRTESLSNVQSLSNVRYQIHTQAHIVHVHAWGLHASVYVRDPPCAKREAWAIFFKLSMRLIHFRIHWQVAPQTRDNCMLIFAASGCLFIKNSRFHITNLKRLTTRYLSFPTFSSRDNHCRVLIKNCYSSLLPGTGGRRGGGKVSRWLEREVMNKGYVPIPIKSLIVP